MEEKDLLKILDRIAVALEDIARKIGGIDNTIRQKPMK